MPARFIDTSREEVNEMLYCAEKCPCLNTKCDLYKRCTECIERHHASDKYPLTACEICEKSDCEQADPRKQKYLVK